MDTKDKENQQKRHVIRVDDDVYRGLGDKASKLGGVDATRNDALRAMLELTPVAKNPGGRKPRARRAGGRPVTR